MEPFRNPSQQDIDALLRRVRTIAVIGVSKDAARPSHRVAKALQGFGYRIVPVNPTLDTVLNEKCWPALDAAVAGRPGGEPIDLVDVFRLPKFVAAIVDDCIRLEIPALWLQDGVIEETAAARAQAAGIMTVMDRCTYRDRSALAAR